MNETDAAHSAAVRAADEDYDHTQARLLASWEELREDVARQTRHAATRLASRTLGAVDQRGATQDVRAWLDERLVLLGRWDSDGDLAAFVASLSDADLARWDTALAGLDPQQRLTVANALLPRLTGEDVRRLGAAVTHLHPDSDVVPDEPVYQDLPYAWTGVGTDVAGTVVTDVVQGGLNDCWFLAALSGELQADPDFVREHMTDNGNGTCTVTFYRDGAPVPVTIDGSLPVSAEGNLVYAQSGAAGGHNIAIYEKAYAQFSGGYQALWNGHSDIALEHLTGRDATRDRETRDSDVPTLHELDQALDEGRIVAIGTTGDDTFWHRDDDLIIESADLVARHAYSVVSVDPDAHEIVLRNPWGSQNERASYIVTLTEEEYRRWITLVYIQ